MTHPLFDRLRAFARHVRRLWPGAGIILPFPLVAWSLGCIALGKGRWEHLAIVVGVPLLAYTSARGKRVFVGLLPIGLLGLVYDAMGAVKNVGVTPERVHLCDLRDIDMSIASVTVNGARGTVHDWVQANTSLPLDLACAVPYGTFIFVVLGFAIYLYAKDYARMRAFGWAFLIVNLLGFVTYHIYPAAPPWYFHAHGCAVDVAARASTGANLARVDAWLGIPYFHGFYGRSSDVFGAVPSLHVSYPLLIVLFGWPVLRWPGRVFATTFFASMCVAAVYLDHHWIIDVILGLVYTVAVFVPVTVVGKSWFSPRAFVSAAAPEAAP